jgi:hypothetical protein
MFIMKLSLIISFTSNILMRLFQVIIDVPLRLERSTIKVHCFFHL